MRRRFYAPCSGSCVAARMVDDDAMPGRVSRNASGLHALLCVVSDRKRKTPREVAAWRLYVWRAALPVGKLCCRTPSFCSLVGSIGFEPTTPTMSRWCSNQLSYEPKKPRIIERVLGEHKPLRENFFNRRVRRLTIDVAARWRERRLHLFASQQNTSMCCGVIHIALWITIRQASGFTVERLRICRRGCESTKSCSVLPAAVHVAHPGLCISLRVGNSVRYGGYPLWGTALVNYHYVYIRTLLTPLDKHSPSTVPRSRYALRAAAG